MIRTKEEIRQEQLEKLKWKVTSYFFWSALFPLAVFLRLYRLGTWSLWYDECASIQLSKLVDNKLSFLSPMLNNEPPMNPLLTFIWGHILGAIRFWELYSVWDDFAWRLLPCFWSILSVIVFYRVSKWMLDRPIAVVIATLLFVISPFQIYYAQELRIYSFYVLLNLLGLLFLFRILSKNGWKDWIGLGCIFVLLMYSHYFSVWTIFITNLFILVLMGLGRRNLFRKWFWTNVVAGIFVLPALYLAWEFHQIVSNIRYVWYPNPTIKTGLITWKNFFAGYTSDTTVYWILFCLSLFLFVYGLWAYRNQPEQGFYVFLMSLVPIFINVFFWGARHFSFYEHRLFIFSGVVALFAIAKGIHGLRYNAVRGAVLFIFILLTSSCLLDFYNQRLHPVDMHRLGVYHKVDFRSVGKWVREHFQEGDIIIYPSHFMAPSMRHYLEDYPQCRVGMSAIDVQVHIDTFGNPTLLQHHGLLPVPIEQATRKYNRLWFLESHGITFEYKPHTEPIRKYLNENWERKEFKIFSGLSVTLYQRKTNTSG
ncbi:MAG TPA: glycosyltransferase family 39 protein [Candidatus Hydrogenedens sp.]|nr:glycosyltransferase family 39 protein [Candidatus Hydrogenedens sp.]HOK09784.1 glycosyltransferase family 39 protein [Candidatus Hydrogenedens sp.]HOL18746.1 glycosyltransferase family 39 protein [Candidatus Hydrogenedens sp.]HPP59104.1 glycosyltransferase family 39 protein [Candidatus Hydrogenedens sp.]